MDSEVKSALQQNQKYKLNGLFQGHKYLKQRVFTMLHHSLSLSMTLVFPKNDIEINHDKLILVSDEMRLIIIKIVLQ